MRTNLTYNNYYDTITNIRRTVIPIECNTTTVPTTFIAKSKAKVIWKLEPIKNKKTKRLIDAGRILQRTNSQGRQCLRNRYSPGPIRLELAVAMTVIQKSKNPGRLAARKTR